MPEPRDWPVMSIEEADAALTAPGSPFETTEIPIRGRTTTVWKNALPTLRHAVGHLRRHEELTFAVHGEERVSYGGLLRAVETLAAHLVVHGIAKGDRVALAMRNLPEWPVAFFAATAVGAIIVPLNAWWTGQELANALIDAGAAILIADGERIDRIAPHRKALPQLREMIVARAERDGARSLGSIIGEAGGWHLLPPVPLPRTDIAPDDHASIFYTSGTTGSPKGALGSHRAMLTTPLTQAYAYARAIVRAGETLPEPAPKVLLCAVPFFHVTGCHSSMLTAMLTGSKLVMIHRWEAGEVLRLIERERVTITGGVPTLAWQLLEHPDRDRHDLSSLEIVAYGGAPAPPELARRLAAEMPGEASTGWGMTETSATVMSHVREEYALHPESCGVPTPVSRLRIIDAETGANLGPNEVGELQVFGPMVVEGYWNKQRETDATFVDGWLRTGDLARIDAEGFCYIVGRAKDLIIRGGENIYPAEIEALLFEHPAIDDAAVMGIPHRTLGEEPVAVVHFVPGHRPEEQALRDWIAARLAAFKVPVRIVALPELLPRNATGKVVKGELGRLFD